MKTKTIVPFGAAPKSQSFGDFHDGTVVSITGDKLVMSSAEGHEYSFRVSPDASVCCDTSSCGVDEIKVGSKIRLTTKPDDKNIVTSIESLNEHAEFAVKANPSAMTNDRMASAATESDAKPENSTHSHEGVVVSFIGNKLVTTCNEGKEHSHTVAADAKVTCDGTVCRTQDLKPGAKLRLTTKPDDIHMATRIESLHKHVKFAPSA